MKIPVIKRKSPTLTFVIVDNDSGRVYYRNRHGNQLCCFVQGDDKEFTLMTVTDRMKLSVPMDHELALNLGVDRPMGDTRLERDFAVWVYENRHRFLGMFNVDRRKV